MWMEKSVDPDQLAMSEARCKRSGFFSKEGKLEKVMHTLLN